MDDFLLFLLDFLYFLEDNYIGDIESDVLRVDGGLVWSFGWVGFVVVVILILVLEHLNLNKFSTDSFIICTVHDAECNNKSLDFGAVRQLSVEPHFLFAVARLEDRVVATTLFEDTFFLY